MAIFVDFVGLNTLVSSSIDLTTNTISTGRNYRPGGNIDFSLSLNDVTVATNLHRNGPYGYSTWTQLRASQNPLTRFDNRDSNFTFVVEPGDIINIKGPLQEDRVRNRFSEIHRFEEPPVTQKTFPIVWNVGKVEIDGRRRDLNRFSILSSYSNSLLAFSNERANKLLKLDLSADELEYELIKELYLQGGLEEESSPLTQWEFIRYQETIYPRPENMFRKEVRGRQNYISFYDTDRAKREKVIAISGEISGYTKESFEQEPLGWSGIGGVTINVTRSQWPMDEDSGLGNGFPDQLAGGTYLGPDNNIDQDRLLSLHLTDKGQGLLMNRHMQFSKAVADETSGFATLASPAIGTRETAVGHFNLRLNKGPLYMRRSGLIFTGSVASPSGVPVQETGSISGGPGFVSRFGGGAPWTAAEMLGLPPMYNSYEQFSSDFRSKYKNFTVLPEFRISNHVENILKSGSAYFEQDLFEITGAQANNSSSLNNEFYKTYSTSDFLKHFEVINEDHSGFTNSQVLSLKCKVVKKLLPYEGFYPCQRTVDLAGRFAQSYGKNIAAYGSSSANPSVYQIPRRADGSQFNLAPQPVMTPLFAPGVLFNSIKAGVACDYPILTSSMPRSNSPSSPNEMIGGEFDGSTFRDRIPFEALLEPENHLANKTMRIDEPSLSGSYPFYSIWDGNGDDVYKLMAHNFIAESIQFFLKDQNLTTLVSKKQGDGFQIKGETSYAMRIRMKRSMNGPRNTVYNGDPDNIYLPPQDIIANNIRETFTMYSRPMGFGPPSVGINNFNTTSGDVLEFEEEGKGMTSERTGTNAIITKDSSVGYNFPFTPPYYHGEAWLDIIYHAPTASSKVTLDEIFNEITESYTRFDESYYKTNGAVDVGSKQIVGPQAFSVLNNNALQLSASINPFGIGELRSIDIQGDSTLQEVNVAVTTDVSAEKRWVIQTKFETPMLNFNHITGGLGYSVPKQGLQPQVAATYARGMWHQLGKIPEENEGVFLQVTPLDKNWQAHVLDRGPTSTQEKPFYEDLSEVCGFSHEPVKLGRIATSKVISEAVVAVPFIETGGRKKFFLLDEGAVRRYLRGVDLGDFEFGLSIKRQIERMKRFVFPPSFDFINNPDVEPIAMYIFEFKHRLDQEDLARIWQGLPPKIAREHEESEVRITHPLINKELLGGGTPGDNSTHELPDELQWMVFKVKQRAANNYFKKVVARNEQSIENQFQNVAGATVDPFGVKAGTQFNWPYDFFSLVELAKIDAEVELNNADFSNFVENMPDPETIAASEAAILRLNEDYVAPVTSVRAIDPNQAPDVSDTLSDIAAESGAAFAREQRDAANRDFATRNAFIRGTQLQSMLQDVEQAIEQSQNFGQDLIDGAFGTTVVLDAFGGMLPGQDESESFTSGIGATGVSPADAARQINQINDQIEGLQNQLLSKAPNTPEFTSIENRINSLTQQRLRLEQNLVTNFNFGPGYGN